MRRLRQIYPLQGEARRWIDLCWSIAAIPNVANVFGRMEQVNIPVSANNGVGTITLISYDDRQLQWAKKVLNQGSIAPVLKNPASVLMLYQEN